MHWRFSWKVDHLDAHHRRWRYRALTRGLGDPRGRGRTVQVRSALGRGRVPARRKVYEGLASVWPTITDDTGFAERVNSIPKYVASRTLEEPLEWNASLIKGDLAESVAGLKRQHRGNLISFGCGELAYELATQGLADEIHFWVNPAVWGSGDRAFHGRQVRMQLIATTAFDSGITFLCYRPAPHQQASRDNLTARHSAGRPPWPTATSGPRCS